MNLTIKPTLKQHEAYEALKEEGSKFITFGGGAGGGKTWLGCEWLLINCIRYPGTKWFMAREELKRLMASSYVTFQKVCSHHNIPREIWKLNGQYNYIEFSNGSRIDLLDLAYKPADPMYERLGSLEYTGGWIDEAGEVNFKAFDVLKSRIGRHLNKEYEIPPKMLLTCNPKKNWLYIKIYKAYKTDTLPVQYKFIQSLYMDNPYTAKEYGEMLDEIDDKITIQRLKYGNWEYDEDNTKMMSFDSIIGMFQNKVPETDDYITIDVARLGKDRTIIYRWKGWQLKEIKVIPKDTITKQVEEARDIKNKNQISIRNILADEDGVGGGFVDLFKCEGFVANSTPYQSESDKEDKFKPNYQNLKAQCADYLAKKVNRGEVGIDSTEWESEIIEECEILKRRDLDKEGKFKIITKEEQKEILGRSPDFLDALIMRAWFEVKNVGGGKKIEYNYTDLTKGLF